MYGIFAAVRDPGSWYVAYSHVQEVCGSGRAVLEIPFDTGHLTQVCLWVPLTSSRNALVTSSCAFLGTARQEDARSGNIGSNRLVSTDPPYYDNIGYADLSDFFYVWLRHSLKPVFPDLFATLAVPKTEELVATPYRHGSREAVETFFLRGMTQALHRLAEQAHPGFPVTIYYAFKQSARKGDTGIASTRLGDVPERRDPVRLRRLWHVADAHRTWQPDDRHQRPCFQHRPRLPTPARRRALGDTP